MRHTILLAALLAVAADAPKKVLLVGSAPDTHPAKTHEYMAGVELLANCLKTVPGVEPTVVKADAKWADGPELIGRADGVVIFLTEGAKWVSADAKRLEAFRAFAARGGGLVCLHWGMGTRDIAPVDAFVALFGGCHGGPDRKYKFTDAAVAVTDLKHPITAGVKDFEVRDEFYFRLHFPEDGGAKPILAATLDGKPETVAWAWERPAGGRSFGFSGLHYHDNWKRVEYRRVVTQGVLWALKLPVPEGGLALELPTADYELGKK